MTKYLNIVESLGHYGLKKIQPKQKLRIAIFLDFAARMLEELTFGKNNGMIRLGLKYEPKIKCQSLKWNCRNILRLQVRGEAHSNLLCLKYEELFVMNLFFLKQLTKHSLFRSWDICRSFEQVHGCAS
jgi:hypothetical protein